MLVSVYVQSEFISFRLLFRRVLIRGPNIRELIVKHISLTMMLHTNLPSFCAHQKSCFCSRSSPRVMTRHNMQHSRMNLSRVHRISRRLPDTSAICSVQITIFASRRAARIYERVDVQNFIFSPPTRNTRARD